MSDKKSLSAQVCSVESNKALKICAILLITGIVLIYGWKTFWFLTDDAFIIFRYASNSIAGYGYTWNPPPFRPVEGYSSFLWLVILDGVWRLLKIPPPASANFLSLLFAYSSLVVASAMILRMKLNDNLAPYRLKLLALALLGTVTNRTFLAWTSSGLETALFNFLLLLWLFILTFTPHSSSGFLLSLIASLTYLARPDGVLTVVATFTYLLFHTIMHHKNKQHMSKRLAAFHRFSLPFYILPGVSTIMESGYQTHTMQRALPHGLK